MEGLSDVAMAPFGHRLEPFGPGAAPSPQIGW
jgi:hypothetical protein